MEILIFLNFVSKDPACCPITTPPILTIYIRYGHTLALGRVRELTTAEIDPDMIALAEFEKHNVAHSKL